MSKRAYFAASKNELPPGARKVVTIKGREILIINNGGRYAAILNKCPHRGAPLAKAMFVARTESEEPGDYRRPGESCLLRCPWHGWTFDLESGKSWCDPDSFRMRMFDLVVDDDGDRESGDLVIETFEVEHENQGIFVYL